MADPNITKLAEIEAKLDKQIAAARFNTNLSLILGIILVVGLLGYFSFMSGLTKDSLEPEGIATVIGQKAREQVKGLSGQADKLIQEEVPKIMDGVIDRAIKEDLPAQRVLLEKSITTGIATLLQQYEDEIYKNLNDALATYGENIQVMAKQLKTTEGSKEFEDAFIKLVNEAMAEESLQNDLQMYGEALSSVDELLARLTAGEGLAEEEVAMVDLLSIVREISRRGELDKVKLEFKVDLNTPGLAPIGAQ
jgi:hypothetical protein